MAEPLIWPSVLMPSSEDWSLRGGSRSGGQTFQGNEQIVVSPTARWRAKMDIPCWEPEHTRAMRRVIALGRTQLWYVGPYEFERAPWGVDPLTGALITYANQQPGAAEPYDQAVNFVLAAGTSVGDTVIAVTRSRGGLLKPGMTFSINGRLHTIVDLTTADNPQPGTGAALKGNIGLSIRPTLRFAYPSGAIVEFGKPIGTMRLASDDTAAMELQLSRYGTVTVELVEAF